MTEFSWCSFFIRCRQKHRALCESKLGLSYKFLNVKNNHLLIFPRVVSRVENCSNENSELRKKVEVLESTNRYGMKGIKKNKIKNRWSMTIKK